MYLYEILHNPKDYQNKLNLIVTFLDNWQQGKYHSDSDSIMVPIGIFNFIKYICPQSIYVGRLYRCITFSNIDDILKMASVRDLTRAILSYKHPNKSQYFAWAKNPSDLDKLVHWFDDEPVHIEEGEEFISLYISQQTHVGIDVNILEEAIVGKKSRASLINEVIAPYTPPLQVEEMLLFYRGDSVADDFGEYRSDEVGVFKPHEFNKLKTFIVRSRSQGQTLYTNRNSRFDSTYNIDQDTEV